MASADSYPPRIGTLSALYTVQPVRTRQPYAASQVDRIQFENPPRPATGSVQSQRQAASWADFAGYSRKLDPGNYKLVAPFEKGSPYVPKQKVSVEPTRAQKPEFAVDAYSPEVKARLFPYNYRKSLNLPEEKAPKTRKRDDSGHQDIFQPDSKEDVERFAKASTVGKCEPPRTFRRNRKNESSILLACGASEDSKRFLPK